MYPLFVGFPSRLSLHRALSRTACAVRHVLVSRLFHTQYRQERLRAGSEGDDRGWDGWVASPTQWTWVWASSGSGWWTGRPGVLWFMGLPRVGHNRTTELIYMCVCIYMFFFLSLFHCRLLQDTLWVLYDWPLDYSWILFPRMGPFCYATGNLSHVSLSDTDYTMSIPRLHPSSHLWTLGLLLLFCNYWPLQKKKKISRRSAKAFRMAGMWIALQIRGLDGKESACSAGDLGSILELGRPPPWPLRRAWQPTPVFWPGESHGQRSLAGYSSWSRRESDMTEQLTLSNFIDGGKLISQTGDPFLVRAPVPHSLDCCSCQHLGQWQAVSFLVRRVV